MDGLDARTGQMIERRLLAQATHLQRIAEPADRRIGKDRGESRHCLPAGSGSGSGWPVSAPRPIAGRA